MEYKANKKVTHYKYGSGRLVVPPDENGIAIVGYIDEKKSRAKAIRLSRPGAWKEIPLSVREIAVIAATKLRTERRKEKKRKAEETAKRLKS